MSSLYSKDYIYTCKEEDLRKILEGRVNYDLSPNNLDNRHIYVVMQHYLINYMEHYGKTDKVKDLLGKYYIDFASNPQLFVDSPLIKNDFLERFVPLKERNKIIEYRNRYYDGNTCKNLYKKSIRQELTESEKNRLYSYLILQSNANNTKLKDVYEYCAKSILNSGKSIKNLNEMELKFYCTYVASNTLDKVPTQLHIMSKEPNNGGYQSNGLVFINKDSTYKSTIEDITQTVCHEVRHAKQRENSIKRINKSALEYGRNQLFRKYLNTEDYDSYHSGYNYYYSDIELDAERSGYFNGRVVLRTLGRGDLADKLIYDEQDSLTSRNYYQFMVDANKSPLPVDTFLVENLDKIMKEHPEEINNYKVLGSIYNLDGNKKSFEEIVEKRMNQDVETRGLYDEYINYGIFNGNLSKIDLNNTDNKRLFESLGSVFRDKAILFKDYCDDREYGKFHERQIYNTTTYQLSILYRMITYIDDNMDKVLDSNDEDRLSNRSFIYDFIYDFRDFDLSNINNKVIENNPDLQEKFDKFKNKANSVIKKFNRQYIKDRIKNLSTEQLNTYIKSPEGVDISLNDYLFFDLLPRLDGHMEVEINGRKAYIGDIIQHYVNDVKNRNYSGMGK